MHLKSIKMLFVSLIFFPDPKQVLKCCLGSTAVGAEYGAVSALSFNRDCTRLLSGFAKGQVNSILVVSYYLNANICTINMKPFLIMLNVYF